MKTKSLSRTGRLKRGSPPLTAKLVRIGNSRGIRLPKTIIEQAGLSDTVEIRVERDGIVIRPAAKKGLRAGWEEQFKKSNEKYGPPEPMDPDWEYMPNDFDEKEWTW